MYHSFHFVKQDKTLGIFVIPPLPKSLDTNLLQGTIRALPTWYSFMTRFLCLHSGCNIAGVYVEKKGDGDWRIKNTNI